MDFVHLHNHSEYSLLDGACRVTSMIEQAKSYGMDSIAITDHGVMYGVIKFYKEALKQGVKPILGCEVYSAQRSRFDRDKQDFDLGHLVLLAENNEGWQNLLKIVSIGYTEGFYYKPRIDMEVLRRHSKGIIALSACLAGFIARSMSENNYQRAKEYALEYVDIFGKDNFFIELQDHNLPEQRAINGKLIALAKEQDIGLVVTNDVHYLNRASAQTHDVLICIQTGKTIDDTDRLRFDTEEFYLKSPEEMAMLFPQVPEAMENTVKIAKRCNVELEFGKIHLPSFKVPGRDAYEYMRTLCYEGLNKRYSELTDEIKDRAEYELKVIRDMGYVDYYLIVWDFIRHAREIGIMVGPGRGSGAGSIVAYALRITDMDPIKYNLLFERFLNPERISMPDFDVDFCPERRQEVIDYVVEKYGKENVSQIITFGTMGAKQAVRDVARVLNLPYADADRLSKLIPFELKMTIDRALEVSTELKALYDNNEITKRIIDIARDIEGMPRHASTHAAGVIICSDPVVSYSPLARNGEVIITQFDMDIVQELGLVKMDFLGLRNLTVIRYALDMIRETLGEEIDLSTIDYSVKKVYDIIAAGYTDGVFQLESSGMKQFMKELKPDSFEDIIAGISLFRPGPMDQIPLYIKNKNNPSGVTYKHPLLKNILEVTYGCMVYQEQVMQIVRDLAGYSLGRADLVRRAMSKKKSDVMKKERFNFIHGITDEDGNVLVEGAIRRGVDEKTANTLFDEIMDFANYAFNKSHAAAYAVVAYQTAYLKALYPAQFMAALLSSVLSDSGKISQYIIECARLNIKLLPPDINQSQSGFAVQNSSIRFGLVAVKNVGQGIITRVVEEREQNGPYTSLRDFCTRQADGDLNKRTIESLIKSGAFDCMGKKRSQLIAVYDTILDDVAQIKKQNISGQLSLFGETHEHLNDDRYPSIAEYSLKELLAMEKDIMGIYLSGHPLDEYKERMETVATANTADIYTVAAGEAGAPPHITDGAFVTVAGVIIKRRDKSTKNNSIMSFINVEDLYGTIEVIVFPKVLQLYNDEIKEDNVVIIRGKLDIKEEQEPKILAEEIQGLKNLSDLPDIQEKKLYIKLKTGKDFLWDNVIEILTDHSGATPVYVFFEETQNIIMTEKDKCVSISDGLIGKLEGLLGSDCVKIK